MNSIKFKIQDLIKSGESSVETLKKSTEEVSFELDPLPPCDNNYIKTRQVKDNFSFNQTNMREFEFDDHQIYLARDMLADKEVRQKK